MDSFGIELENGSIIAIAIVAVVYIAVITAFGGYFARFNKNINDFFYSGNRFSWWLPAASMVATGIGSYSYLKYSEQGYNTGMSSTMTYLNDWFLAPFFLFGWLPIIYFARIKSVPEYFERRFNRTARYISLTIILAYMFFYIGYNLYTIGVALEGMFGVPQLYSVPILAAFLGAYVTFGGQTAVIFTDLFQGIMLYVAGGLAIFAGIYALGGFDEWWAYLPVNHRLPFVHLTDNPMFNSAGLFWGEALAGSIAFTFMNQGFLMRYLTIKSVNEGRKAAFFNVMVTLPVSAVIVGAIGWIGKSLVIKQTVTGGALAGYEFVDIQNTFHTFIIVCWATVKHNAWIFGFIVAALMAALMSTIDTLINACAAIGIYDLYKPLIKPEASDEHYLKAARWASIITTFIGLLLVIWFHAQKGSLMSIHYKGIMIIIPAIVTTIFMGAFWKRFNATAACASMILGSIVTVITVWFPDVIDPLAWFLSGPQNGIYIYFRALFGMLITAVIGFVITLLTSHRDDKDVTGLTIDTLDEAMHSYKGGEPNHEVGKKVYEMQVKKDESIQADWIEVAPSAMTTLKARDGDLLYMTDSRWWLGGLRSYHVKVKTNKALGDKDIAMSTPTFEEAYFLPGKAVTLEKII
ncbi:MAG: sodium:solute symporter family protein [Bdellovibrionales bacterium]|nr:sodium:solute symporter family protein [Bdellovibrionales bacterium]